MRLIDADVLKEAVKKNGVVIDGTIDELPHIDIVRCKECKWAESNKEGDYDCKCHIPIFRVAADDYCSYGERGK